MAANFDAVIVGTGQAGPPLAARLTASGMKVAVIEENKFGGTCINNGCTPTKAMVASAYAAHLAQRAADFGVALDGTPRINMQRVKARKDDIVRQFREGVERRLRSLRDVTIYRGHARFTDKNTIRVGDELLAGGNIFLDVGGRPRIPDMPGISTVPYLTSVTMMDLEAVPEHLLVIGGSYVGLEFAQMLRRFGSRVTIVEMSKRLLSREDDDVSLAIQDFLTAEDIQLRLSAECISLQKTQQGLSVGLDCGEGAKREDGTHLLLAVGRAPNTADLGLSAAGVETDSHGYVTVAEDLRTSNPRVWALGDCNGKGAFTHTAYNDYEIVADNLLSNAGRKYTDRVPVYALYTDPPLGRVGTNEAAIRKSGRPALVGKLPMTQVARAIEKGETKGFLKVYADRDSKRILGASLLGTGADEAVHSLLDAIYAGMPYSEFQRHVRIHPTVSELLPTVIEKLQPLT
jgi:pyruvate/2-oxoglutarate dehydrogenase complex dihydrolipoamide dehydrogenase (E3) component